MIDEKKLNPRAIAVLRFARHYSGAVSCGEADPESDADCARLAREHGIPYSVAEDVRHIAWRAARMRSDYGRNYDEEAELLEVALKAGAAE